MIPLLCMNMANSRRTYIIAEIGTSHGGSIDKACTLIDAAKDSGADCAKFQWIYADEILHPKTGFVQLPTGSISLYERFKSLELPDSFYRKVMKYARQRNLDFGCSPFGVKSLRRLYRLKPDMIKIASPELNHFPMLKELVKLEVCPFHKRIPVIISSGVSMMEDIEKALRVLSPLKSFNSLSSCTVDDGRLPGLSLLHCITSYPAPEDEYNLSLLRKLSDTFGLQTGVSDHSLDPLLVPLVSVAAGGRIIEKHITLSKDTDGLDDPVALTPDQFSSMTDNVRKIEAMAPAEALSHLRERFGGTAVDTILGNGEKHLAPSEEANYTRTNRSIHFLHDMKAGQKIRSKDIAVLRTEKILSPGISPEYIDEIKGRRLNTDVSSGSGLLFEMLEK